MDNEKLRGTAWFALRVTLAITMLWAFFDKLLGLGFKTCSKVGADGVATYTGFMCEKAWVSGGHPTAGFLAGASKGWLGGFFKIFTLPGVSTLTDILFMMGLLGIGIALLFGAGMRIAGWSGALLMVLMYLAGPPFTAFGEATNIIMDDHLINAAAFMLLAVAADLAVAKCSIANWWRNLSFVKDRQWLW